MLIEVFQELDNWVEKSNQKTLAESGRLLGRCYFKVLGQTALLEAKLDLALAQTADLDAYTDANYAVTKQLDLILAKHGMHLDSLSSEVWMPEETVYDLIYDGQYVQMYLAQPDFILVSKALKAPERNFDLIAQYVAEMPSERFFKLCKKYSVDLDMILEQ